MVIKVHYLMAVLFLPLRVMKNMSPLLPQTLLRLWLLRAFIEATLFYGVLYLRLVLELLLFSFYPFLSFSVPMLMLILDRSGLWTKWHTNYAIN